MFCPDCGRERRDAENFCSSCGYPLKSLEERIEGEKHAQLGWAEKIIGKKEIQPEHPSDKIPASFATSEAQRKESTRDDKYGSTCDRCGQMEIAGAICPICGNKLPTLGPNDHYLWFVLIGSFRMLFAPKYFAMNLPYPVSRGNLQPVLYPGIFASIFIITLPFLRPELWRDVEYPLRPFLLAMVYVPVCLIVVPLLTYISSFIVHILAILLGGRSTFRRCLRVLAAIPIWLMILGILYNGSTYLRHILTPLTINIEDIEVNVFYFWEFLPEYWRIVAVIIAVFIGWQYAWMVGGLYRMPWGYTLVHTLATYLTFYMWSWGLVLIFIPLRIAGII